MLAVFKGPTSKGREGNGSGRNGSDGKGEDIGREGGREEEGGRDEGVHIISRILLFEPWQLCVCVRRAMMRGALVLATKVMRCIQCCRVLMTVLCT